MKYADVAGSGLLYVHVLHLVNQLHNGKWLFQCSLRRVTCLVLSEGVKWVNPCRFAVVVSVGQKTKTKNDKRQKADKEKKVSHVCSPCEEQHKVSFAARGLPLPVLCCSPSSNMNGFKKLFNALHIRSNGML